MLNFRIVLSGGQRKALVKRLAAAEKRGDVAMVKRLLAIDAIIANTSIGDVARTLQVSAEAIRLWIKQLLLVGVSGLQSNKSPGRPSKLTKTQKRKLSKWIKAGPAAVGYLGNCWRSPMIQHLIREKFGVLYSVHYISELLKNMGFSYQKARFVSGHLDKQAREQWLTTTWPEILAVAKRKNAYVLFGDEASFPQWGTLSYTWAPKGEQPTIETCGKRKGYKVFGLIDYFTGRFFYKCQEGRLNSDAYMVYLKEVLAKTRKHVILIQDGAPYHRSAAMKKFFEQNSARLTVYRLPSYSPDYNPIEKLWKKVKEKGTHLHYFPTFEDLKNKVEEALLLFKNTPKEVLSLFVSLKEETHPSQ
jgi:transposase